LKAEENDLGITGGIQVSWRESDCIQCGVCEKACRSNAITIADGKISVADEKCNFCGRCVKACPTEAWDTVHGYIVSFGGLFGNSINKGETVIPFIADKEKLMRICDAAIQFFDDNANAGERFKFTIDRVGREKFESVIMEAYNG
jgi:dissimilatory sulfite reductase (desulfoviridin) alpha/beta subunit